MSCLVRDSRRHVARIYLNMLEIMFLTVDGSFLIIDGILLERMASFIECSCIIEFIK